MTMHSGFLKEHEGTAHNPIGHVSSAWGPWWSGLGSQSGYGESAGHLKSSFLEHSSSGDGVTVAKHVDATELGLGKGNTPQFTIFPGNCKVSTNGPKPSELQTTFSMLSAPPEYRGRFELGFGQPVICANYPYGDQCYGVFSTCGPQITGRIMLPLNLSTDDGPIYVNAKQYHGILRRRQSRAKAESENKVQKNRKPFLHMSRHLHAMRRPRGCGGRFLNTKKLEDRKGEMDLKKKREGKFSQPTGSQNSEVLQSDGSNSNSPREANASRSTLSGSEVTSMYSRGDLNCFPFNNLLPSALSLSEMMSTGHGMIMPSKWVAATDSCCNLKV
ncbi:hypothetical protein RJ640_003629 [Escallonia rubra]|uniref:Nuclear transcription factor Y subunit n=1 Tax=Escallonia rubra TaxID=112253 RepID=A0AA88UBB8_9ASTE|nr:hypothetical protein RJ640_003629 [Escallonia rubra]